MVQISAHRRQRQDNPEKLINRHDRIVPDITPPYKRNRASMFCHIIRGFAVKRTLTISVLN
jgi:hypothetical protein